MNNSSCERKLRVCTIDDCNRLPKSPYERYFELHQIKYEGDLLSELRLLKDPTRRQPIDIWLIDINLEETFRLENLNWGVWSERPLGPVLLLPFLEPDHPFIFETYSVHWASPAVYDNPYVLVSFSLLLSLSQNRDITIEGARNFIIESQRSRELVVAEPAIALRQALTNYRKLLGELALAPGAQLAFLNIKRTIEQLSQLDDLSSEMDHVPVPLKLGDSPVTVEFVAYGAYNSIEVGSLFGDVLGFEEQLGPKPIRKVAQEVQKWQPYSLDRTESIYDAAGEVIRRLLDNSELRVKDLVPEIARSSGVGRFKLMRLVMLFAWVIAWHEQRSMGSLQSSRNIKIRVLDLLGLRGQDRGRLYNQLLGQGNGAYSGEDPDRRPFASEFSNAAEAYEFRDGDPSTLTTAERWMCRRFAQYADTITNFAWDRCDNSAPPYPDWMRN